MLWRIQTGWGYLSFGPLFGGFAEAAIYCEALNKVEGGRNGWRPVYVG